jgi:general secretion pathway protein I
MTYKPKHVQRLSETAGFTLIEVLVALAIVALALVALLRLHLISLRSVDQSESMCRATLIADQKIAETLAGDYPQTGTTSGVEQVGATSFEWQREVSDLRLEQLSAAGPLRSVSVNVRWPQGAQQKQLSFKTYVAQGLTP